MNADERRFAQHLLNKYGFPCGAEDGVWGAKSRAALAAFQRAWNGGRKSMDDDGWFGPLMADTGNLSGRAYAALCSLARPNMGGPYLSPHFTVHELRSKGNGDCFVRRELLHVLEVLRDMVGPFSPISVYRDPAHNARIPGAASNSQHIHGTAADLSKSLGVTIAQAEKAGAHGIGYHKWSRKVMHVDVRGSKARWTY